MGGDISYFEGKISVRYAYFKMLTLKPIGYHQLKCIEMKLYFNKKVGIGD